MENINGKNFMFEFNMRARSFDYQPLDFKSNLFLPETSFDVVPGPIYAGASKRNLVCEFKSKLDVSRFMQEIISHDVNYIDIGDEFIYKCYFDGSSSPSNRLWQGWYVLTIPFLVITLAKEVISFKMTERKTSIYNPGTYKTPLIIKIKARQPVDDFLICGYKINHINADDTFVIDGVEKRIYSDNDNNRFSDVEMTNNSFPYIEYGINVIEASSLDNVEVEITFQSVYI